jgi:general nucleoside transport system ATP-binding protein
MGVIFISHKLDEVMRVSDRVAVLRGGKLVAQSAAADCTAKDLARWMMGVEAEGADAVDFVADEDPACAEPSPQASPACRRGSERGEAVCELQGVVARLSDREQLRGVDLRLSAGEITAIAGVSGNGQLALASLLCGTLRANSGSVKLLGLQAPKRAADWVALGVARVPEDRRGVGVVGDLSFWENAISEHLGNARVSRWGFVQARAARAQAAAIADAFDVRGSVRGADANLPVSRLSGGNMQKLILGRALMRPDGSAPKLVVAHQPTWGLDVGAVAYVQQRLREARDAGAAVLLISDDLDEILRLADRVAVMHAGHLTQALPTAEWTRESIGLAMAGASHEARQSA